MNPTTIHPGRIEAAIDAACERIAPTWPLDQFIAVNPWWGWRSSTIEHTAARLGALCGTRLTMPRAWYREQWSTGRLSADALAAVAAELGDPSLATEATTVLERSGDDAPVLSRLALATDVRALSSAPRPGQSWADLVIHQIGQHCGAHFDEAQSRWHPADAAGVYAGWLTQLSMVHGIDWHRGARWARVQVAALPTEPVEAIATMLDDLGIPDDGREAYLTALALSVNGWAAWCAYRRWQARLSDSDDQEITGLLAIRLAWEWLLHGDAQPDHSGVWQEWARSWSTVDEAAEAVGRDQRIDWVLQLATERTYQTGVIGSLADGPLDPRPPARVQAVFCIDVRSEVFRRAFEAEHPSIHTRGFAGFFGLPIAYTPAATGLERPQLPGLLAPALHVSDRAEGPDGADAATEVANRRAHQVTLGQRWNAFKGSPSSMFSFVETIGLVYGPKLVHDSLPHHHGPTRWEHEGLASSVHLRPVLDLVAEDPASAAAVAHRVLTAMGLTDHFAPLVLLCGHGSHTTNNPHAAGLDCGACGGQTGEVNARALAGLLNDATVRGHLAGLGITVPTGTWFVPAMHVTTTDEVILFDTDAAPADHAEELSTVAEWLAGAGRRARAERAPSLGLGHLADDPEQLRRAVTVRANDWSQVRPEWGLAANAAFIVAPRQRTSGADLGGRTFLHDYDCRSDTDLAVLTLIMTAPMVVTNWINLQYYASTVDNSRYGSGNKVLHNVVGGRLGVFEGNGGDLRIGLALQSLHDGVELRHPPLRLSVFIEAPQAAIDTVIAAHEVVQHLVGNGWLHLLRIEPTDGSVERWSAQGWVPAHGPAA